MTPIYAALARLLPRPVARVVLAMIYAALLLGSLIALGTRPPDILYIDIPDIREAP